ncbi:MAG: START domain-containing protein [Oligoflexus sp.]
MLSLGRSFIVLALSSLPFLSTSSFAEPQWEKIGIDNGVEVFRKQIPGSPLVGFKGVKVMNLPITKVSQVILDRNPELQKKWIDRIQDFQIIEQTPYSAIFYSSYGLPWPIANRDYVIRSELKIDNELNRLFISLQSIEHPKAPKTIGVRAELVNSRYEIIPLPNNQTQVTVEILTDPKGSLPSWLVNLIQRGWPAATLNNMERQAALPETPHNKLIQRELKVLQQYSMKPLAH